MVGLGEVPWCADGSSVCKVGLRDVGAINIFYCMSLISDFMGECRCAVFYGIECGYGEGIVSTAFDKIKVRWAG